jgi:cyclic pyranopterin phosphate synthase
MARLSDGHGRRFYYLRLSVTEVCNFRCAYCLPDGHQKDADADFLSEAETARVAAGFATLGVGKVRLTGGEPTARKDIGRLITRVAETSGVAKVAMTTNGWNLAKHARDWRTAGLTALNVSIDSLDARRFAAITGHDRLDEVVAGVDRAIASDYASVKVNAVLLRDNAEAEFRAFADFVRERPVAVRFIELMRTRDNVAYFKDQHLSGSVFKAWLDREGWIPRTRAFDDGPAVEYVHPDHAGRLGLIAPYGPGFCDSCNRLRITARGKLRLCLFGEGGVDLRDLLQSDDDRDALVARIEDAMSAKPATHRLAENDSGDTRHLAQLGG